MKSVLSARNASFTVTANNPMSRRRPRNAETRGKTLMQIFAEEAARCQHEAWEEFSFNGVRMQRCFECGTVRKYQAPPADVIHESVTRCPD